MSRKSPVPVAKTVLRRLQKGPELESLRFVQDQIPYTVHLDRHTVRTKNGHQILCIALEGLAFETMDTAELNYRTEGLNTLWRSLASSSLGLYYTVIRRRVAPPQARTYRNRFCGELERRWTDRLGGARLYENQHVLTLVRRDLGGSVGQAQRWLRRLVGTVHEASLADRAREENKALHETASAVLAALESYGARLLQVESRADGHEYSEVLEFLGALVNQDPHPMRLPAIPLDRYLGRKRIIFGPEALEVRGVAHDDVRFGAILAIKEYAAATSPGVLTGFSRLPHEGVMTQTYACEGQEQALRALALQRRRMGTADDQARSLRAQLEDASDDVASGHVAFGTHHFTILLTAPSRTELDQILSEALAEFTQVGIVAVRSDATLETDYWAQLPGNFPYRSRPALISSTNWSCFAPFYSFPRGARRGHWGAPITVLETTSGTPYAFHFHPDHSDVGNFTVIGPTGSGKTVFLNFLLAQAQDREIRSVYFDRDRGAEIAIRAMGGSYLLLRPGQPSRMNPFSLPDSPLNRSFLSEWVPLLVRPSDGSALPAREREAIAQAVEALYEAPPEFRCLSNLHELLRGYDRAGPESLFARMKSWVGSGDRAWLFDTKDEDLHLEASMLGFDLTVLLEDPIGRVPALAYLFHCIEASLDGRPTLLFVDEAWRVLEDPEFARRLKDWLKTIRKKNGIVGFGSQSATDATQSPIAATILEQSPTQIWFPNRKGSGEAYASLFGLTRKEVELIRTLPDTSRCMLIKQGRDSVVARLDLTGLADVLTVLSGRAESVRRLDALRAQVGDDPADWLPLLQQAGVR